MNVVRLCPKGTIVYRADWHNGKSYEQLLGRLVQYLRSGMELDDATARLRESLMPDGECSGREFGEAGSVGEGVMWMQLF